MNPRCNKLGDVDSYFFAIYVLELIDVVSFVILDVLMTDFNRHPLSLRSIPPSYTLERNNNKFHSFVSLTGFFVLLVWEFIITLLLLLII